MQFLVAAHFCGFLADELQVELAELNEIVFDTWLNPVRIP